MLQQTGGVNSATNISVGAGGGYLLDGGTLSATNVSVAAGGRFAISGGTLQVNANGSFVDAGLFQGGGKATLTAANSTVLDFSQGILQNLAALSVSVGSNSLTMVPAGFNPATGFGSFASGGLVHTVGTTLTVPAGQGFGASCTINDPVVCQGTIAAPSGGAIYLNNGLTLSGSGSVNLGGGSLTVNDTTSGMTGGSLSESEQYIGNGASGLFTHSGGTNTIGNNFYLGYNSADTGAYVLSGAGSKLSAVTEYVGYGGAGSITESSGSNSMTYYYDGLFLGYNSTASGAYNLSGSGQVVTHNQYVGYSGKGTFTQSGGTNTASGYDYYPENGGVTLGDNAGSSGAYILSGGQLSTRYVYVGSSGTGTFSQSGGTSTLAGGLSLAVNAGSAGTCNLTGGVLATPSITAGSGAAAFIFGGGTLQASGNLSTSLPMTLTATGGNANVNTNGNAVTLSGTLSGPGGLNKSGAGTLTLAAANSFSGNTTIAGGVLALANTNALQQSTLDYNNYGGTLSFGTLTKAALGGLQGSQNLALANGSSAALALSVGGNGQSTAYSGVLSGGGSLTKLGSGTLMLTGADSYTGLTTVEAGTLVLGVAAQNPVFSLGGVDIQGGSLILDYSGTSPAATIESILTAGYALHFAAGSGQIFSSTAAADGLTLGWSDNGSSAVTIMATLSGDANLGGRVDINDLTIVLSNFGSTAAVWSQGDFNYDGRVDVNDLTIVLTNFEQSLGASSATGMAPVPEPGAIALLGIATIGLFGYGLRFARVGARVAFDERPLKTATAPTKVTNDR